MFRYRHGRHGRRGPAQWGLRCQGFGSLGDRRQIGILLKFPTGLLHRAAMWQRLGLGVWDRRWYHDGGRHGTHGLCRGQWLCLDGFRWCRRFLDPGHGRGDRSGRRLGCDLWRLNGSRFRLDYRNGLGRWGRFTGGRRCGPGFWRRRGLGLGRQRLGGRHRGGLFCWRQGLGRFHLGFGGFRLRRR